MTDSIERNLEPQLNNPEILGVIPSETGMVEGEISPNISPIIAVPDPSDSVESNIGESLPIVPKARVSLSRSPLNPEDARSFSNMIEAKANGIGPEEYSNLPLAA